MAGFKGIKRRSKSCSSLQGLIKKKRLTYTPVIEVKKLKTYSIDDQNENDWLREYAIKESHWGHVSFSKYTLQDSFTTLFLSMCDWTLSLRLCLDMSLVVFFKALHLQYMYLSRIDFHSQKTDPNLIVNICLASMFISETLYNDEYTPLKYWPFIFNEKINGKDSKHKKNFSKSPLGMPNNTTVVGIVDTKNKILQSLNFEINFISVYEWNVFLLNKIHYLSEGFKSEKGFFDGMSPTQSNLIMQHGVKIVDSMTPNLDILRLSGLHLAIVQNQLKWRAETKKLDNVLDNDKTGLLGLGICSALIESMYCRYDMFGEFPVWLVSWTVLVLVLFPRISRESLMELHMVYDYIINMELSERAKIDEKRDELLVICSELIYKLDTDYVTEYVSASL